MAIERRSHRIRQFQKLVELDEGIAERAGYRRASREILVDERLDDALLELALQIDHVVRHADVLGHAPRIVYIVERTAAAGGCFGGEFRQAALIPELHGQAGDVVARRA